MEAEVDHPKLYLENQELLSFKEVLEILDDPDPSKVTHVPPANPQGGKSTSTAQLDPI